MMGPYITMAELGAFLGKDAQWARRFCLRHEIAFKVGRRWVTTKDRLRLEFPEIVQELELAGPLGKGTSQSVTERHRASPARPYIG